MIKYNYFTFSITLDNSGILIFESINASPIPEIICQIPHQAAINAIPPLPLNNLGLKMSTNAKPEF